MSPKSYFRQKKGLIAQESPLDFKMLNVLGKEASILTFSEAGKNACPLAVEFMLSRFRAESDTAVVVIADRNCQVIEDDLVA